MQKPFPREALCSPVQRIEEMRETFRCGARVSTGAAQITIFRGQVNSSAPISGGGQRFPDQGSHVRVCKTICALSLFLFSENTIKRENTRTLVLLGVVEGETFGAWTISCALALFLAPWDGMGRGGFLPESFWPQWIE